MDVIITVLILLEAIIVLVWMDMNWNQITTLVQVQICTIYVFLYAQYDKDLAICQNLTLNFQVP